MTLLEQVCNGGRLPSRGIACLWRSWSPFEGHVGRLPYAAILEGMRELRNRINAFPRYD